MADYFELVERFIPSQDMRAYLRQTYLNHWQLVDIIYLSPVNIAEKQKGLKNLLSHALTEGMEDLIEYCKVAIENIENALRVTQSEGIFTSEECSCDSGSPCFLSRELDTIWNNYEDALSYIKNESHADKPDEKLRWYEITKWYKPASGSKYEPVCTYTVVHGELWFVNLEDSYYKDDYDAPCMSDELYLPVPFVAGDIIEVDGYPYNPKKRILITSIGDNSDCCSVQVLSKDSEGIWKIGALKHGMIGDYRFPMVAPLFSAQRVQSQGEEIDKTLKRLSDFIIGNKAKVGKIEMIIPPEGITDEELNIFIDIEFDEIGIEKYLRRKEYTHIFEHAFFLKECDYEDPNYMF